MAQYIDKSALIAEIEKAIDSPAPSHDQQCPWEDGYWCGLYTAEGIIDALEVKEVDFDDFGFYWGEYISNLGGDINNYEVAKYFYELGIKSQTKDMTETLRTEYEKGRADVIADTLSWLANCWPKYCSNPTIIEGFKEAMKE